MKNLPPELLDQIREAIKRPEGTVKSVKDKLFGHLTSE